MQYAALLAGESNLLDYNEYIIFALAWAEMHCLIITS